MLRWDGFARTWRRCVRIDTVAGHDEGTRPMDIRPTIARQTIALIAFLAIVALVAFLGSLASSSNADGWYAGVEKVPWDPPNAVFGPVWSVLYGLIALAGWLIWRAGWLIWRAGYRPGKPNAARRALTWFIVQLVLNGLWTPAFFAAYPVLGEPAWWIALAVIVALIGAVVALAIAARQWSRIAAWLMLPYLAWLLFATTLNIGIIALN
ncbi:TspO/MBR family protein [Leucobacter celer]|uniref:TspO/MBR family protein n=1 Tax=Leucobacter celer TaxID=668625 RepID=UPI001F4D0E3C|nr:TspO/MBR family protein [Leucobacter celer]